MLDARWLDLLKANGVKLAFVAIACAVVLWISMIGWIPPLEGLVLQLLVIAMVVCGLLAIASIFTHTGHAYEKLFTIIKRRRALAYAIDTLNPDETDFLKEQIRKGEITVQLNPFNAGSIRYFVHRAGMFQGLQSKGIVSVTAADPEGKIQSITINSAAWKILKKKFKIDTALPLP
jgi:hypothetical protein